MKKGLKSLIISIAVPLAVGGLSALISGGGMQTYADMVKPALSPPGWLFPVVWTILYVLMGIAYYLVATSDADSDVKGAATAVYIAQLVFNFFWSLIFFGLQNYLFAFIWLVILWVLIFVTMLQFFKASKTAAYLFVPYLLWVTFAGYLNFAVYLLN